MEQKHIYMDYAATTYVKPEVLAEMTPYFTEYFGNPSSVHSYARETKKAMDHAREQIAEAIAEEVNLELWLVCCDQWANLEHVALEARCAVGSEVECVVLEE